MKLILLLFIILYALVNLNEYCLGWAGSKYLNLMIWISQMSQVMAISRYLTIRVTMEVNPEPNTLELSGFHIKVRRNLVQVEKNQENTEVGPDHQLEQFANCCNLLFHFNIDPFLSHLLTLDEKSFLYEDLNFFRPTNLIRSSNFLKTKSSSLLHLSEYLVVPL